MMEAAEDDNLDQGRRQAVDGGSGMAGDVDVDVDAGLLSQWSPLMEWFPGWFHAPRIRGERRRESPGWRPRAGRREKEGGPANEWHRRAGQDLARLSRVGWRESHRSGCTRELQLAGLALLPAAARC